MNLAYYMAGSACGQDESKSCVLIGYPSRQDGRISCPLGIAHVVPAKAKFFGVIFCPYNKSFIDQACSVRWPDILRQYPAILAEQAWSITHDSFVVGASDRSTEGHGFDYRRGYFLRPTPSKTKFKRSKTYSAYY